MPFEPSLLDEIRARLPVSAVVARRVNLKKQGREFAGLSPFKTEKTPSFFVNDHKGFYHCFASGEHGDIFTFVMKTEGLTFPEAVERLAAEAGVSLPKPSPQAARAEQTRDRLRSAMEAAATLFQRALRGSAGREASAYLQRRGLTSQTVAEFRLGYAPPGRHALSDALKAQGFSERELIEAGLMIAGAEISKPYDRFRNRVMFPITDLKGRVVAFGGRALDPNERAKYMNSPETPLFHKGKLLFNAQRAREPAHQRDAVIAVEGYMDAIALHQAGFSNVVAPLGTALTEDQLQLLWRLAPVPTLCFDGDSAGRMAAHRAVDAAMPALKAGHSLSFVFLPDKLDPDDMVRQRGPEAFARCLNQPVSLGDVLWQREWNKGRWETPEARAALEKALNDTIARITDQSVRYHYQQDIKQRLYAAWRAQRQTSAHAAGRTPGAPRPSTRVPGGSAANQRYGALPSPKSAPGQSLKQSALVNGSGTIAVGRETLLLNLVLDHPSLLDDVAEEFAALPFASPAAQALRTAILDWHARNGGLDSTALHHQLSTSGFKDLLGAINRGSKLSLKFDQDDPSSGAQIMEIWAHVTARHSAICQLERDLADAIGDFDRTGAEADYERIIALRQSLSSIDRNDATS